MRYGHRSSQRDHPEAVPRDHDRKRPHGPSVSREPEGEICQSDTRACGPLGERDHIPERSFSMEDEMRYATFTFFDNSKLKLAWPKQGSRDAQVFANQLKD